MEDFTQFDAEQFDVTEFPITSFRSPHVDEGLNLNCMLLVSLFMLIGCQLLDLNCCFLRDTVCIHIL